MQNKWQQLLADRSERVQQKTRKKRYGKYILRWMITLLILVMLVFGSICGLRLRHFYRAIHGEIPAESPDLSKFPVKGIDISRYQGDIDWDVLSKEDHVQFAFILEVLKGHLSHKLAGLLNGTKQAEGDRNKMLAHLAAEFELSEREKEALTCMDGGMTNAQIAENMGISLSTVKKHVYHIFEKVGVDTRAQLRNVLETYNSTKF